MLWKLGEIKHKSYGSCLGWNMWYWPIVFVKKIKTLSGEKDYCPSMHTKGRGQGGGRKTSEKKYAKTSIVFIFPSIRIIRYFKIFLLVWTSLHFPLKKIITMYCYLIGEKLTLKNEIMCVKGLPTVPGTQWIGDFIGVSWIWMNS